MSRPEIEGEGFLNPTEHRVISSLLSNGVQIGELSRGEEVHYPKDGTTVTKSNISVEYIDDSSRETILEGVERTSRRQDTVTAFDRIGDKFNRVDVVLTENVEAVL